MKRVLIIGCSGPKTKEENLPLALYTGGMYQLINKNLPDVSEHFRVLIVSAFYGLIDVDNCSVLKPYESVLDSDKKVSEFIESHSQAVSDIMASIPDGAEVSIILSKRYRDALKGCLIAEGEVDASRFEFTHYQGIGYMRGALKNTLLSGVV
ncbi:DUF6884 domain-containing protein [Photobacterium leiognathi]|uniref:DUF6884 domain-containing protein n=1 Tax=Photobacterium leiognathi TaxID=553611 RepID=UPI002982A32B|nr:DUF6884 domain-containing protein [Photobacterium leiognathi]